MAEEMKVNQEKAFRFPIKAGGDKGEVWISVFMDDINSPDLSIFAQPKLLKRF